MTRACHAPIREAIGDAFSDEEINELVDRLRASVERKTRQPGYAAKAREAIIAEAAGEITREVERGYDRASGTAYHNVTTTGPNGQTVTRGGETSVAPGSVSRSRSITGPQGASVSREATRSYDPATGTVSTEVSKTGPNGGTVVRDRSHTY